MNKKKHELIQSLLSSYDPSLSNNNSNNNLIPLNFIFPDQLLPKALRLLDQQRITIYQITPDDDDTTKIDANELLDLYLENPKDISVGSTTFEMVVDDQGEFDDKFISVDLESWFCSCYYFNSICLPKAQVIKKSFNDDDGLIFARGRNLPQFQDPGEDGIPPTCHHLLGAFMAKLWIKELHKQKIVCISRIGVEEWIEMVSKF